MVGRVGCGWERGREREETHSSKTSRYLKCQVGTGSQLFGGELLLFLAFVIQIEIVASLVVRVGIGVPIILQPSAGDKAGLGTAQRWGLVVVLAAHDVGVQLADRSEARRRRGWGRTRLLQLGRAIARQISRQLEDRDKSRGRERKNEREREERREREGEREEREMSERRGIPEDGGRRGWRS